MYPAGGNMFKRLLSLYNGSKPSQLALEWAVKLGEIYHADLKVLSVIEETKPDRLPLEKSQQLVNHIRTEIDKDVRQFSTRENQLALEKIEIEVATGKPIKTILPYLKAQAPDLVVLGGHSRAGILPHLLGGVAEKVVRHSPFPILIPRKDFHWPPTKVLVPVDVLDYSTEIFEILTRMSSQHSIEIHLLHVMPLFIPANPTFLGDDGLFYDPKELEHQSLSQMDQLRAAYPNLEIKAHVVLGSPAQEICRFAEENQIDLVILSTHGHEGLTHLLIGSVAEQVVRYIPCTALVYHLPSTVAARQRVLSRLAENDAEIGVGD